MEQEGVKKKQLDRDFKISAVAIFTEDVHKAVEVARSLGIHPSQIYNRKRAHSTLGYLSPFEYEKQALLS